MLTRASIAAPLATAALTGIWLAMTARAGLTYHFHPLLIAACPGVIGRLAGRRPSGGAALLAIAMGVVFVSLGSLGLVLLDAWPTATFWHGQPGGTAAETAAATILGAVSGGGAALWSPRRR